ncbi:MAG: prepilin-type N-terminal cleavage/methylation domain-containing protein [Oscillospiraceae bacterium]|nr:prepilin-type N-terminal cleavage/methylation domain-containing protein [Oscillospiraceae bacterium]
MTNTLSAINALKAKKNKKGFTLMEMLIVVAIIAILVAIAIPVFNAQLTKAKEQVDAANLRSATSMAVVDYLSKSSTGSVVYTADKGTGTGADSTMTIRVKGSSDPVGTYPSEATDGEHIEVTVTDGGVVSSADWK